MASSDIEWTESTWNPIAGCEIVSPGCTNCYAMRMAARLQAMGMAKYAGTTRKSGRRHVWTGKVNIDRNALSAPLAWKKPQRIFVNSMSDLFQEKADVKFIRQVWRVMQRAHWHSFQILTKRPERMLDILSTAQFPTLANVWLGTSVESEAYLDRIEVLRRVPARVRFISFEPLLGAIIDADLTDIHWVIAGGESGPRARPMETWWVEELRELVSAPKRGFFLQAMGRKAKEANRAALGRSYLGRLSSQRGERRIDFARNVVCAQTASPTRASQRPWPQRNT